MLPVIALVGRPNVGKSTLFNRLTRSRDALVADYEGLTRDRKYGEAVVEETRFIVIDTGGLSGLDIGIDEAMAQQSLAAIDEADEVVLMVDAKAGLMPADESIVREIRRRGKPFVLVANKIDGMDGSIQVGTSTHCVLTPPPWSWSLQYPWDAHRLSPKQIQRKSLRNDKIRVKVGIITKIECHNRVRRHTRKHF